MSAPRPAGGYQRLRQHACQQRGPRRRAGPGRFAPCVGCGRPSCRHPLQAGFCGRPARRCADRADPAPARRRYSMRMSRRGLQRAQRPLTRWRDRADQIAQFCRAMRSIRRRPGTAQGMETAPPDCAPPASRDWMMVDLARAMNWPSCSLSWFTTKWLVNGRLCAISSWKTPRPECWPPPIGAARCCSGRPRV